MLLNLRQLEIFRAIMVAKTINGAAELLHVSQPGISRALKYIEQRLGITLFERSKGRLVATPEAEELYRELQPIYEKLEGLEWTMERITLSDKQQLRIGSPPSLVRAVLPKALASCKQHIPNVLVRIDAISNEELADYIDTQKGSYAISFYDPKHPNVLAEKIFDGKMVCALPLDHPLCAKATIDIKDLAGEEMILYHADTAHGRLAIQLFKQANIKPNTRVSVRYNDDACAMVEEGLGISLVSNFVTMNNAFPKLKMIPLIQPTSLEVYILRHKDVALSHASRSFFDYFKEALQSVSKSS